MAMAARSNGPCRRPTSGVGGIAGEEETEARALRGPAAPQGAVAVPGGARAPVEWCTDTSVTFTPAFRCTTAIRLKRARIACTSSASSVQMDREWLVNAVEPVAVRWARIASAWAAPEGAHPRVAQPAPAASAPCRLLDSRCSRNGSWNRLPHSVPARRRPEPRRSGRGPAHPDLPNSSAPGGAPSGFTV